MPVANAGARKSDFANQANSSLRCVRARDPNTSIDVPALPSGEPWATVDEGHSALSDGARGGIAAGAVVEALLLSSPCCRYGKVSEASRHDIGLSFRGAPSALRSYHCFRSRESLPELRRQSRNRLRCHLTARWAPHFDILRAASEASASSRYFSAALARCCQ